MSEPQAKPEQPLLQVKQLTKHFPVTSGLFGRVSGQVRAVEEVSFELQPGETLGLVGESGCGKTTLGRSILRLLEPTSGQVLFEGRDVTQMTPEQMRVQRRDMQIIFQDPFSSLNPRMRVLDIVGEALQVHGIARGADMERRAAQLLQKVGVPASWVNRYPHEFSGGQRQRIGVARAIALNPKLIVCDEAVSALDVSIQAQVVNLLIDLRQEMNLAYLFIAHDLSVVRHISHRVAVMYLGQIVELSDSRELFDAPLHPYTQALLSAIPIADPRRRQPRVELHGDVPTPLNPPSGCRFHTRCPAALEDRCSRTEPELVSLRLHEGGPVHQVRCVHAADALEAGELVPLAEAVQSRIEQAVRQNRRREEELGALQAAASEAATARAGAPETFAEPDADSTLQQRATDPERSAIQAGARLKEAPPPVHPAVGAVLMLTGLALAPADQALLSLAALVTGFLLFRPHLKPSTSDSAGAKPSTSSPATYLAAGIALLFFALVAAGSHRQATEKTLSQLAQLRQQLDEFEQQSGSYPRSLSELGWRLHPIFPRGKLEDAWGQPWRYRFPGSDGRDYDLGSTGRNKTPGKDDIGHLPPSNTGIDQ